MQNCLNSLNSAVAKNEILCRSKHPTDQEAAENCGLTYFANYFLIYFGNFRSVLRHYERDSSADQSRNCSYFNLFYDLQLGHDLLHVRSSGYLVVVPNQLTCSTGVYKLKACYYDKFNPMTFLLQIFHVIKINLKVRGKSIKESVMNN